MKAVIQRVESAQLYIVEAKDNIHNPTDSVTNFSTTPSNHPPANPSNNKSIEQGIVALIAIEKGDTHENADKLLHTIINYRLFSDAEGRMSLPLADVQGGLMLVSQFTLAASTRKGLRPSFSSAAVPDEASGLFAYIVEKAQELKKNTGVPAQLATGVFGAMMKISLINDGPVTFILQR